VSVKWASFIVAIVALAQVWVIALWRRFFRKGTLDIHETGVVEVGYSQFGPTVALQGTLRAVNHDQFVQRIQVVITRNRDGAQHWFEWETFRSGTSLGQMTFETPAGFLVTTNQPQRFNVFFSDHDTRGEVEQALQEAQQGWQEKFVANPPTNDEERAALYEEYKHEAPHFNTHARLTRLSYWTAGRYRLLLYVITNRPDRQYERQWSFELTEGDEQSLRLNAIPLLMTACGFSDGLVFNFGRAQYEEPD
jgi:hypothetical protein